MSVWKGLERLCLIGSAMAGYNHAKTIINASVRGLHASQDDYNKILCSLGSLVNNLVK